MPTDTFFRLTESKQHRIKEALKEEVAGYKYEDFSINRIIRSCGISRGSFYQYFKNRQDIYIYLVSDYNRLIVERALAQIRESGGSFFTMFENTVLFSIRMFCHKDSREFRNHLFQGIVLDGLMWKAGDFSLEAQPVLHELVHLIDMDGLRVEDTQELLGLIHLCVAAASPALSYILLSDGDELLAREMLLPKIELLRKGSEK